MARQKWKIEDCRTGQRVFGWKPIAMVKRLYKYPMSLSFKIEGVVANGSVNRVRKNGKIIGKVKCTHYHTFPERMAQISTLDTELNNNVPDTNEEVSPTIDKQPVEALWLLSKTMYLSLDMMIDENKFIGFIPDKYSGLRHMIITGGIQKGLAIRPTGSTIELEGSGNYKLNQQKVHGKYFVFETEEALYNWLLYKDVQEV